jgi:tripartite-type tricarboxylate transporter receptor subunit TctC
MILYLRLRGWISYPPEPILKKLFEAVQIAMAEPKVETAFTREGTDADVSKSAEQFNNFLNDDAKFWIKLVKSANVTVD